MALRRPILALGPTDADYAKILSETKAGISLDFNDEQGIKTTLKNYFQRYLSNNLEIESGAYEKYSRKNLAKQFISLIQ